MRKSWIPELEGGLSIGQFMQSMTDRYWNISVGTNLISGVMSYVMSWKLIAAKDSNDNIR